MSFPPSGDIYEKILEETLEQGSRCGKEIMEAGRFGREGKAAADKVFNNLLENLFNADYLQRKRTEPALCPTPCLSML